MSRFQCIAMFIALGIGCTFAQNMGRTGIGATTNTFSFNNAYYGEKGLRNTVMVNGRYFIVPSFAIDGAIGFGTNSSVNADTAALTPSDPGILNVSGQLGVFWKLTPASWQSYIGVTASGGIGRQKWYDAVTLRDTTRVLPAPPAKDYATYTLVEPYNVIVPFMSIGMEPGYAFDRHFSLFATFGINAVWYPDSKAIDSRSISTNNVYVSSLPLVERKDASFEFSIASVGLGVRYYF
jgi:hypothetical protein